MDLRFTRSQRLGATSDDQNDGLVFYESLQHPKTVSEGPKRLPQVQLCASERPPGGPDPVSWTQKENHPPSRSEENAKSWKTFLVTSVVRAALASRTLLHMGK